MSETPRTVAIGAFVTGALLIAVTVVLFALGTRFGTQTTRVVMAFDGSIKGLKVGAPVALRGVQIGQVTNIELLLDSGTAEAIMVVEADLNSDNIHRRGPHKEELLNELIGRGLRAQLGLQSLLTGLLYVQLDFRPGTQVHLADIDSPYQQIPTIPTELERLSRELETFDVVKLANDLESIASGLAAFVGSDEFRQLPAQLREALGSVQALSAQLRDQVASTGTRLDTLLDGANETVDTTNANLPQLVRLLNRNLEELEGAVGAVQSSMQAMQGLIDYDSDTVYQLNRTLREVGQAARALHELGRELEEHPESLIRGRSGD